MPSSMSTPAHAQARALAAQQLDDREADRVGPPRRARGEDAVRRLLVERHASRRARTPRRGRTPTARRGARSPRCPRAPARAPAAARACPRRGAPRPGPFGISERVAVRAAHEADRPHRVRPVVLGSRRPPAPTRLTFRRAAPDRRRHAAPGPDRRRRLRGERRPDLPRRERPLGEPPHREGGDARGLRGGPARSSGASTRSGGARRGAVRPNPGHARPRRGRGADGRPLPPRDPERRRPAPARRQPSGSIEIHGSLFETRCSGCEREPFAGRARVPRRPAAVRPVPVARPRGLLRPAVVWFGEMLDPLNLHRIIARSCDEPAAAASCSSPSAPRASSTRRPASCCRRAPRAPRRGSSTPSRPDNARAFHHFVAGPERQGAARPLRVGLR